MRLVARSTLLAGAFALSACGFADSHAPLPAFMRIKAAEPPAPEPVPDIKLLMRDQLDVVFMKASYPRDVRAAPPHRAVRGAGWTACVQAELTSATGTALGVQTYVVTVLGGKIVDRRRADADDNCGTETFEPVDG